MVNILQLPFLTLLAIMLSLTFLACVGLGVVFTIERLRRWRADRLGFADFLSAGAPLNHEELMACWDAPALLDERHGRAALLPMGDLSVPSGKIVVEDPSCAADDPEPPAAFDINFPIGRFPVEGLVLTANDDQRLAAVRVHFRSGQRKSLEPAFTEEWRVIQARTRRELPWFGIDSATAAIGTPESFGSLLGCVAHNDDAWGDLVPGPEDGSNSYLSGNPRDLFREAAFDGGNAFVVLSGMGDGTGQCYIERDLNGQVLSLVIDFGMLGEPTWAWSRSKAA